MHSLFHAPLAESIDNEQPVSRQLADQVFEVFKTHPLFNWQDSNNGCEGRADAVCRLLEAWGIPCYKGWVFSGTYLKKHPGQLKQNWKYHVAAVVAVEEDGSVIDYIIDPATGSSLQRIQDWAASITEEPHSYYFTREAHWYIFPEDIHEDDWNSRNRQNRKWMIQCLAGINSMSPTGKAALVFARKKIERTEAAFEKAKREKPGTILQR